MNRRRILIVTTSYLPMIGGSELAIYEITRRLPEFDFDLITGMPEVSAPRYEKIGNLEIYRVGSSIQRWKLVLPKVFLPISIFQQMRKLSKRHTYTLVHAFQASAAAGGVWLSKLINPNLRFLLTIQEGKPLDLQSWPTRIFRKLIISKADQVTAISKYLVEYVKRVNPSVPVDLVPNGVTMEAFSNTTNSRQSIRDSLNVPNDKTVIITVSRLVQKNGIENLIRAFAMLSGESVLVVVGNGPLAEKLKHLANELNVSNKIRWVGTVVPEDVPGYLSASDIFVRPSLSEGLGNAFLEAFAARLPIVAPMVGGIVDFLKGGENGLVCDPNKPADIAAKIDSLVENPGLRYRLGGAGHNLVVESYNWEHIARRVGEIYNSTRP